jgi:hypothetical protein
VLEEGSARPTAAICPLLEGLVAGTDGEPAAIAASDEGVCRAFGSSVTLSNRQLELACLSSAHLVCPRYLHGRPTSPAHVPEGRDRLPAPDRPTPGLPALAPARQPILAAALVLLLSAGIAGGYLLSGGTLRVPSSSPALVAAASQTPNDVPSPTPDASPSPELSPSLAASASPEPSPSPAASPSFEASAVPSPSPVGAVDALFPKGGRWDHLAACPGTPDCYVYTVQRNDTLYAIAGTFHIPLKAILALNPQITNSKVVHVGQKITLPTPTP